MENNPTNFDPEWFKDRLIKYTDFVFELETFYFWSREPNIPRCDIDHWWIMLDYYIAKPASFAIILDRVDAKGRCKR
jgi:hypothetical protein